MTLLFAGNGFAQEVDAQVPVVVSVNANVKIIPPPGNNTGTGDEGAVTAGAQSEFNIKLVEMSRNAGFTWDANYTNQQTSISHRAQRQAAGAWMSRGRGSVNLNLQSQQYDNAVIALHSVNGRQILNSKAAVSSGASSISRSNIPAGVYLLSVKGAKGSSFTTRLTHNGGRLDINVAFTGENSGALRKMASDETFYGLWSIIVSAPGFSSQTRSFAPAAGRNELMSFTLAAPPARENFTETLPNGVSFDMVYVPGGTFTLGCERASGCPPDTRPVEGVTVSPYFMGKTEVTGALWQAVMEGATCTPPQWGGNTCNNSRASTWYAAQEFACKLSQITGKNYRMMTEAEFEFAAKKHREDFERMGTGEEWAYNTWSGTHSGGVDPIGPGGTLHNQKTRRDAPGDVSARLIRSIEGSGPVLRLVLSAAADLPPGMVHPCNIHVPKMHDSDYENTYRDMRWVTGDDFEWGGGFGNTILKVWEDGTATLGMPMSCQFNGCFNGMCCTNGMMMVGGYTGEWYSVNNFVFKIDSTAARTQSRMKFAYIFVNDDEVSVIPETGNIIGRLEKRPATINITKPAIPGTPLSQLASAPEDRMWDMGSIPQEARGQDSRLFNNGAVEGWWQDNRQAGGTHFYRKDVDAESFRFIVYGGNLNDPGRPPPASGSYLAGGPWFTVNNTFLRVTHSSGHVTDYLYTVNAEGRMYHVSFMDYERADFRQFMKTPNADVISFTGEIPKDWRQGYGISTFEPAKMPCTRNCQ